MTRTRKARIMAKAGLVWVEGWVPATDATAVKEVMNSTLPAVAAALEGKE